MKIGAAILDRLASIVTSSLSYYKKKLSNDVHVLPIDPKSLKSSTLNLSDSGYADLVAALGPYKFSGNLAEAVKSIRSGLLTSAYVTDRISGQFLVTDSKATLDSILISALARHRVGSILEYDPEDPLRSPGPLKEKVASVLRRMPLQAAKGLVSKVYEEAGAPGSVKIRTDINIPANISKATVVLRFTTEDKFSYSKELDTKLSKAVLGYANSGKLLEDLQSTGILSRVQEGVESIIAGSIGTKPIKQSRPVNASLNSSVKSKTSSKAVEHKVPQLRNLRGQFTSPSSLQSIINNSLAEQIQKNMGTGSSKSILNYRTGRFAESASVTSIIQGKTGMLTAFYTYMKYPYQTFEPGFAQGSPLTRNPKLLISKSIREIAATQVSNKMRAVLA